MRLRQLLEDDDAVSPVIGVILMVAITVILAAVIASFVLGLGPGEAQPSASFNFEEDVDSSGGTVTVTHDSGDSIPADVLYIRGDNGNDGDTWADIGTGGITSDSEISSGDSVDVSISGSQSDSYTVRVVWDNGDNSATLSETSA